MGDGSSTGGPITRPDLSNMEDPISFIADTLRSKFPQNYVGMASYGPNIEVWFRRYIGEKEIYISVKVSESEEEPVELLAMKAEKLIFKT